MSDQLPDYPWSDLIESEDGKRLITPVDGRYVYGNSGELKSAVEGESRIHIQWDASEWNEILATDEGALTITLDNPRARTTDSLDQSSVTFEPQAAGRDESHG